MNSLSSHLTGGLDHGRLGFHPDCPMCRNQRLCGNLAEAVLSARARAGLLAAALWVGTLLPAAAAAASPAASQPAEPQAAQAQPPVAEPAPPPQPPLPSAPTPPAPEAPLPGLDETQEAPIDEAPQVRELLNDPDVGADSGGEDIGGEDENPEPAPPVPPAQPLQPAPPPLPAPEAPAPQPAPRLGPLVAPAPPPAATNPAPMDPPGAPFGELVEPEARPDKAPRRERLTFTVRAQSPKQQSADQPDPPISPAPPQGEPMPAPAAELAAAQATTGRAALRKNSRTLSGGLYVVRAGDSLWSIAKRELGPGASAGQVARMVSRLWELNSERIATGNPNLLAIGTQLRLP